MAASMPTRPKRPAGINELVRGQLRAEGHASAVFVVLWVLLCWLMASWAAPAQAQERTVYTVSVVPQFPATEINRIWAPLLERLAQETGQRFELHVSRDIPSFEAEVRNGEPDFAYLNPYHQLVAEKAQGYIPLVRDREPLSGLVVVHKDSALKSPKDLQGQSVAFPAPHAFGATLMVRAVLAERDQVKIEPQYARTHTNAYRLVATGQAAAAGGLRATLNREPEALRQQLRVLMETPGSAAHPLSAHPRVPAALRTAVQRAWLKLAQDPALKPLFADIPMANPMAADHARDYAPLANLHLERLAQ